MVFWGLILAVAGFLSMLFVFLDSFHIFSDMQTLGFGAWLMRTIDIANLTAKKVVAVIGLIVLIVGIVLFFIGRAKAKKTGEQDAQTKKGFKFFRDLKGEFSKITWPALPTVIRNTGVTLALCAILGLIICLIDLGLWVLIDKLLLG